VVRRLAPPVAAEEAVRRRQSLVPFPGGVTSNRVSVEEAPIRVLEDGAVELAGPNKITGADFQGWVQERGLYFFGANDSRYTDLIASTDQWPNNPGEKSRTAHGSQAGQGHLDLRRPWTMAATARRHAGRVPDHGEPDQPTAREITRGQTGVRRGSDGGQTGVRRGSDQRLTPV
jgi:hypothetical protein